MNRLVWNLDVPPEQLEMLAKMLYRFGENLVKLAPKANSHDALAEVEAELGAELPELDDWAVALFPQANQPDTPSGQLLKLSWVSQVEDRIRAVETVLTTLHEHDYQGPIPVYEKDFDAWLKALSGYRLMVQGFLTRSADPYAEPVVGAEEIETYENASMWVAYLMQEALEAREQQLR